jgi:hypothetical protein
MRGGPFETFMATRGKEHSTPPTARAVPLWWTVACVCIVLLPFLATLYAIQTRLQPTEYDDSFAYVWRGPINLGFFTNRSLTQRVLFWLCDNHLRDIARLHLAGFAASALVLFWLLAPATKLGRSLVALLVAAVFSSYSLSVGAVAIVAEPLHVALLLTFPVLLFLGRGRAGRLAMLGVGLLFLFSKNTAPFVVLFLLAGHGLLSRWGLPTHAGRERAALAVAAVAALVLLRGFDTSVHTNLANNILGRMLVDEAAVERLLARDGMPPGDYVTACRGGNVLTPCFEGQQIHDWHPEHLNYRLRQDRWGFAKWVAERGGGAYARYLIWDRPAATWSEVWGALDASLADGTVAFMTGYLDLYPASPARSNLQRLAGENAARRVGFLGFDPAALLTRALGAMGMGTPVGLGLWLLAALALFHWRPSPLLGLGITLTLGAVALFALAYVGDAIEVQRHVYPALLALLLGAMVLLAGIFTTLWTGWRARQLHFR